MALQVPFEAVGISDFLVHPIEKGVEYTVLAVSPDGFRFQAQLPDGTLGWFPIKFVRILENQPQQNKQQAQPRQPQNQQIPEDELRRREYETAKRDAQDKELRRLELQNKIKKQPQRAIQQPEEDEEILYSVPTTKLGTYAETRGYLANAPGFGKNLQEYIEESEEVEPELPAVKTPKPPVVNETKAGVYKKFEERADGPKYVPTDTLPEQYKNTPWKCHSCSSVNSPEKGKCHLCGTQRGIQSVAIEGNTPKQDWTCSSCKVVNNANKDNCVMCGNKYRPPAPSPVKGAAKEGGAANKKKAPVATGAGPKKKQITSKAGAGIELKYAKGVDNCTYKAGSNAKPGHGAGY